MSANPTTPTDKAPLPPIKPLNLKTKTSSCSGKKWETATAVSGILLTIIALVATVALIVFSTAFPVAPIIFTATLFGAAASALLALVALIANRALHDKSSKTKKETPAPIPPDLVKIQRENERLKADVQTLQEQLKAAKPNSPQKTIRANQQIEVLKKQIENLEQEAGQLRQQNEALFVKANKAIAIGEKLEGENRDLKEELDALKIANEAAGVTIENLNTTIELISPRSSPERPSSETATETPTGTSAGRPTSTTDAPDATPTATSESRKFTPRISRADSKKTGSAVGAIHAQLEAKRKAPTPTSAEKK